MGWLKKIGAVQVLIISVLVIVLTYTYIFTAEDNDTFYLKDIYGDRTALDGVSISGVLQDAVHNTAFLIEDGKVETSKKYYQHYNDRILSSDSWSGYASIDGIEYSLNSYVSGEYIAVRIGAYADKSRAKPPRAIASTVTEIVGKDHAPDLYFPRGRNINVMVKVKDKLYFIVPITRDYFGKSGIYVIDEFEKNYSTRTYLDKDEPERGKVRLLTEINLIMNEFNLFGGVQILGIEAVNDKLVLLLFMGGDLVIRTFDPIAGEQTGEIILEDFSLIELSTFVNGNILGLSSLDNVGTQNNPVYERVFVCLDMSDDIIITQKGVMGIDKRSIRDEKVFDVTEKNGKLFAVVRQHKVAESYQGIPGQLYNTLMIYIYENSKLVYKGELVTDAYEDLFMTQVPQRGYYSQDEVRNFEQVDIR